MNISNLFRFCSQQSFVNKACFDSATVTLGAKTTSDKRWGRHVKATDTLIAQPKTRTCTERVKQFGHSISRYFRHLCNRSTTKTNEAQQQRQDITVLRTGHALLKLQERYLRATENAFIALNVNPDACLNEIRHSPCRLLMKKDRPFTKRDLHAAQAFKPMLINQLQSEFIKMGFSESEAKKHARQAFAGGLRETLATRDWRTISTHFHHNGLRYGCTLVPAAEMKCGTTPIVDLPHATGGIPSSDTQITTHANNLWTTELHSLEDGARPALLFKGVRHGILSPFGLAANSDVRFNGARNRALNVVTAALYARPDLLRDAEQGNVVSLTLASTSLVTGGHGGEKGMLEDQMLAWKNLNEEKVLHIPLRNARGEEYVARVKVEVAAFNFGVNELALKAKLGWHQADGYNLNAFKMLLGDNLAETSAPQGWAGRYLADNPTAANAHKVRVLCQQLKAIWADKSHHYDGGEPYKAALRVSLLAYEIGAVPCWNCKSGKDRTSMLDAELKREVVKMHQQNRALLPQEQIVSTPGAPLARNEQQLLQAILRSGGNKEIQEYNTGAPGNKVIRMLPWPINLSIRERIGDQQAYIDTKGLSNLV